MASKASTMVIDGCGNVMSWFDGFFPFAEGSDVEVPGLTSPVKVAKVTQRVHVDGDGDTIITVEITLDHNNLRDY